MKQELTPPSTEQEFRDLQDYLYKTVKEGLAEDQVPSFKGLLEIASSDVVIVNSIHKIKANKGSRTPGVDGITIHQILTKYYYEVIEDTKHLFKMYRPQKVRRVYIPKAGKSGKRPLGIPTIADRVIQECIRQTIEPILEAQFFRHSYGFRPMRDTKHAIERIVFLQNRIGHRWVIEGDIKGFFDNVNHTILVKQLWHMGIKDQRVLMIIKAMLKAGIMKESEVNQLGTPQGGIISPLLANVYLHKLDRWITHEWEEKKTRTLHVNRQSDMMSLTKYSTITHPEYYVRYADDWVLFTNSEEGAEKWKYKIKQYLKTNLKLELSDEKTHITNITKKPIKFLGFTIKALPIGKNRKYLGYVYPDKDKVKAKFEKLAEDTKNLKHQITSRDWLINDLNLINSKIRGIINYYNSAPGVNLIMRKFRENLKYTGYKALKKYGGQWKPTNICCNMKMYDNRTEQIPAVFHNGQWFGLISLSTAVWKKKPQKNQDESPYSPEGREMFSKRTNRRPLLVRVQELMDTSYAKMVIQNPDPKYNFEYFMNRCYAYNRDKGKCKICGKYLEPSDTQTHHLNNKLTIEMINKVPNLVSLCTKCHVLVHKVIISKEDILDFGSKEEQKLQKYREIIQSNNDQLSHDGTPCARKPARTV